MLNLLVDSMIDLFIDSMFNRDFKIIFRKQMVWTDEKDELLCREIFAVNVFVGTKRSTVAQGTKWEKVAENLNKLQEVYFKVDKRAVRDRYNNLSRDLRKKIKNEEKASGIETDMTNVEKALEDLIEREDAAESEQREVNDQKKQDRENAADMRNKAMESLGQTQKRKEAEDDESGGRKTKKKRASGNETVAYLREKNERLREMHKEELEMKRVQLEVESNKEERFMKMMLNQQQQQQKQMDLMLQPRTKLVETN